MRKFTQTKLATALLSALFISNAALAKMPETASKSKPTADSKPPLNFQVTKWKEIECLSVAMIGEARHVSQIAMEDVAIAVLSRVNHSAFDVDNACESVYQRKQFSFLISDVEAHLQAGKTTVFDKKGKAKKLENWDKDWDKVDFDKLHQSVFQRYVKSDVTLASRAVEIADRLLYENEKNPIQLFTNYYAVYLDAMNLTPSWSLKKNMTYVKTAHNHKFYRLKDNETDA